MNARVQAYSEKIDVEPGTSYTFECAYRLLKGRGNVAVRWGQAGVVFSIKGGNSQWLKLSEGIKSRGVYVALYAQKLGAAEHEKLSGNEFEVPDGVTEVTVYVQAIGDSTIEVDAVELSKTK